MHILSLLLSTGLRPSNKGAVEGEAACTGGGYEHGTSKYKGLDPSPGSAAHS